MRNPSDAGINKHTDLLAQHYQAGEKKYMRYVFLLITFLCPLVLQAELPPSAYEAMQAKAPEYLDIEILRVDVSPGDAPNQQKVLLLSLVNKVTRTATNLKPGDIINIVYTITDHPKGWTGPREIPIPSEREKTIAYLAKDVANNYLPAARAMTFRNF